MTTYHDSQALGMPQRTDAMMPGTNTRKIVVGDNAASGGAVIPTTGQIWPRGVAKA